MSDGVINTWVRQVIGTSPGGDRVWVAVRVETHAYETEHARTAFEDMADQAFLAKHPGGTITERAWRNDPLRVSLMDDVEDNECMRDEEPYPEHDFNEVECRRCGAEPIDIDDNEEN